MTITTIAIILDLPANLPHTNGKSFLQNGKDELIKACQKLEYGDRIFINGNIYNDGGQQLAAIDNFKPEKFYLPQKINEYIQTLTSMEGNRKLIILTDQYVPPMNAEIVVNDMNVHMWSTRYCSVPGINWHSLKDFSDFEAYFSQKDEHLPGKSSDYLPLSF